MRSRVFRPSDILLTVFSDASYLSRPQERFVTGTTSSVSAVPLPPPPSSTLLPLSMGRSRATRTSSQMCVRRPRRLSILACLPQRALPTTNDASCTTRAILSPQLCSYATMSALKAVGVWPCQQDNDSSPLEEHRYALPLAVGFKIGFSSVSFESSTLQAIETCPATSPRHCALPHSKHDQYQYASHCASDI
jgi:hypothetical protein